MSAGEIFTVFVISAILGFLFGPMFKGMISGAWRHDSSISQKYSKFTFFMIIFFLIALKYAKYHFPYEINVTYLHDFIFDAFIGQILVGIMFGVFCSYWLDRAQRNEEEPLPSEIEPSEPGPAKQLVEMDSQDIERLLKTTVGKSITQSSISDRKRGEILATHSHHIGYGTIAAVLLAGGLFGPSAIALFDRITSLSTSTIEAQFAKINVARGFIFEAERGSQMRESAKFLLELPFIAENEHLWSRVINANSQRIDSSVYRKEIYNSKYNRLNKLGHIVGKCIDEESKRHFTSREMIIELKSNIHFINEHKTEGLFDVNYSEDPHLERYFKCSDLQKNPRFSNAMIWRWTDTELNYVAANFDYLLVDLQVEKFDRYDFRSRRRLAELLYLSRERYAQVDSLLNESQLILQERIKKINLCIGETNSDNEKASCLSDRDNKLRQLSEYYSKQYLKTLNRRVYTLSQGLAEGDEYAISIAAEIQYAAEELFIKAKNEQLLAQDDQGLEEDDLRWAYRDTVAYAKLMLQGRNQNPDWPMIEEQQRIFQSGLNYFERRVNEEKEDQINREWLRYAREALRSHVNQAQLLLEKS